MISIQEEEQESDDHMTYRETEVETLPTKYKKTFLYIEEAEYSLRGNIQNNKIYLRK